MKRLIRAIALLGMLVLCACPATEYRTEKIRLQNPGWDPETLRKVSKRQIEPGMTPDMVAAALGKPDSISIKGEEEIWGYAVFVGDVQPKEELVYFVYFRDGAVTRTDGDRNRLKTLTWYE